MYNQGFDLTVDGQTIHLSPAYVAELHRQEAIQEGKNVCDNHGIDQDLAEDTYERIGTRVRERVFEDNGDVEDEVLSEFGISEKHKLVVHELRKTRFIKPVPAELISLENPEWVNDNAVSWRISDCFDCAEYFEGLNTIRQVDGEFVPLADTEDMCALYVLHDLVLDQAKNLCIVYDGCDDKGDVDISFEAEVEIGAKMQKILTEKLREALPVARQVYQEGLVHAD